MKRNKIPDVVGTLRKALPEPMKKFFKRVAHRFLKNPPSQFKPYLKTKNVEGVIFDFWISDSDGRDWYDLQCTDPEWVEMRFMRDHLIESGDIVFECGGHHGCTAILLSNWVGAGGKVVAFEALPANCAIFSRNIQQNRIRNVGLEKKAVGAEPGKVLISGTSNSSVSANASGEAVRVELTCLMSTST